MHDRLLVDERWLQHQALLHRSADVRPLPVQVVDDPVMPRAVDLSLELIMLAPEGVVSLLELGKLALILPVGVDKMAGGALERGDLLLQMAVSLIVGAVALPHDLHKIASQLGDGSFLFVTDLDELLSDWRVSCCLPAESVKICVRLTETGVQALDLG